MLVSYMLFNKVESFEKLVARFAAELDIVFNLDL